MADLTRAQAAEQLAGYVEAVGEAAEAGAVNADPADVFTVACRMGADALADPFQLERATLTLAARVATLERHLAEARMLARYLAGQPCLCEQPALPVTGGPLCAPCDAAAWLSQFPGQPKPDAAGQPAQPATGGDG